MVESGEAFKYTELSFDLRSFHQERLTDILTADTFVIAAEMIYDASEDVVDVEWRPDGCLRVKKPSTTLHSTST
jgi:hypothetical protein